MNKNNTKRKQSITKRFTALVLFRSAAVSFAVFLQAAAVEERLVAPGTDLRASAFVSHVVHQVRLFRVGRTALRAGVRSPHTGPVTLRAGVCVAVAFLVRTKVPDQRVTFATKTTDVLSGQLCNTKYNR